MAVLLADFVTVGGPPNRPPSYPIVALIALFLAGYLCGITTALK